MDVKSEQRVPRSACSWGRRSGFGAERQSPVARDDDGDGFCKVHVHTMARFWSLWRSWLHPHRGILQRQLPIYLGFFESAHNVRMRSQALLAALMALLVT